MATGTGHVGLHVRNRWRAYAWLLPAVLGAAATALLSWSAWITARYTTWPDLHHAWWWILLRPDQDGTLEVTSALWLASLASYWWPRRLQRLPIALSTVVSMIILGGALTTASLVPCRGHASHAVVLGWLLSLYLGNQPAVFVPGSVCAGDPPLAMQLGEIFCPGATVIGVLAVAAVLWREPVGRLRSRFARHATVFTGLSPLTLPLLRQLTTSASERRSPRDIIVIEPDEGHPLLDEARLTGARVIIGDPSSERLLEPIISGLRGCALYRLYAVRAMVHENEAVVSTAARILRRFQADTELRPHLVALVDDPRHADAWRGRHGGTPGIWFEDALSSVEVTACWLVGQVIATKARELLLCGDSSLALAILLELARRSWEFTELAKAAVIGAGTRVAVSPVGGGGSPQPLPVLTESHVMPVERVVLLHPKSGDIRREYVESVPSAVFESGPTVVARATRWNDQLLATLDAKEPAAARQTAVVIVDSPHESGLHEGGRVARLHPGTPVFVPASPGEGISHPIFGQLIPFERGLLVDGKLPEDTWRRLARHWHECYRLSRPVESSDPKAANRLPWADLDPSIRLDNNLQLRSILTQVTALGRRWVPVRLVPPGSFITLSDTEIEKIAVAEHDRWYQRRTAEGWSVAAPAPDTTLRPVTTGQSSSTSQKNNLTARISAAGRKGIMGRRSSTSRANKLLVPWEDLPASERAESKDRVRKQVDSLEEVGFMPVLPPGSPARAASFDRIGIVDASRLTAPLRWTLESGDEMRGNAGDWRVADSTGGIRTVTDPEFRSSHEPLGDGRWRRTGIFKAWQVAEAVIIRTKEGNATARPGDWIVEGSGGERWPVSDDQFQSSYRARADRPVTAGQASTPAAISSTTAPTISS
jgi:hypothetical protein